METQLQISIRSKVTKPGELSHQVEKIEEMLSTFKKERTPVKRVNDCDEILYLQDECCLQCQEREEIHSECGNVAKMPCNTCNKHGVLTKKYHYSPEEYEPKVEQFNKMTCSYDDKRYFITFSVEGKRFKALIDTGAGTSIMNRKTALWCRRQGWKTLLQQSSSTPNNETTKKISGGLRGFFTIAEQTIRATFLVLESLEYDALMGMDVLSQLGLEISLRGKQLVPSVASTTTSPIKPVKSERTSTPTISVTLDQTITPSQFIPITSSMSNPLMPVVPATWTLPMTAVRKIQPSFVPIIPSTPSSLIPITSSTPNHLMPVIPTSWTSSAVPTSEVPPPSIPMIPSAPDSLMPAIPTSWIPQISVPREKPIQSIPIITKPSFPMQIPTSSLMTVTQSSPYPLMSTIGETPSSAMDINTASLIPTTMMPGIFEIQTPPSTPTSTDSTETPTIQEIDGIRVLFMGKELGSVIITPDGTPTHVTPGKARLKLFYSGGKRQLHLFRDTGLIRKMGNFVPLSVQ